MVPDEEHKRSRKCLIKLLEENDGFLSIMNASVRKIENKFIFNGDIVVSGSYIKVS